MTIDVTIDFSFLDRSSAQSVGWYVADPGHECFKVGVVPGAYGTQTVVESLSLVRGVDYVFVLEVVDDDSNNNGEQPSGSYTITTTDILFASEDTLKNKDVTRFTTPY